MNKVECPYCGEVHEVSGGLDRLTCNHCKEPFKVKVQNVVKYEAEPLDNIAEHKGYIITQSKEKSFIVSKVVSEHLTKNEAIDAFLDAVSAAEKQEEKILDKLF